ncbi:MAG: aminotransferase class I/II-fold pyridoxal phosphate-dependent enzyme, partial [Clostridia bacterium]|nr:aminotransferase class I/II-fold pyridoxal phosphate-dependent enzyme [Clostridia bacterium]
MKWAVGESELPMWVADMDFKAPPAVIDAVKKRAEHGIYGYSVIPDEFYESMIGWWERRHQFQIEREWMIFCSGVISAVTCAVKRLTNPGDKVLVQTPVYHIFFHSIENHGRHVLENKLHYENGAYRIDFEDLEQKLSHPLTKMMILCNPQNPAGIIWSKEELLRIGELCERYHVVLLSDEIHCDLVMPGFLYTPYASVSELCKQNSITCISTSKTFNLAGLNAATVVIPNEALRQIMDRGLNADELAEPNAFAIDAVIAAYTTQDQWVDDLRIYLQENKKYVREFLE